MDRLPCCIHCGKYHSPVCETKPLPTIDGARYNPIRTERKYKILTSAGRITPRTSLRHRLAKLNEPGGVFNLSGGSFSPGVKIWGMLFVVLSLSVGIGAWAVQPSNGLFHHIQQGAGAIGDPLTRTLLWQSLDTSGAEYGFKNAVMLAGANCAVWNVAGNYCVALQPNATDFSIALSKVPVDFSSVSGKALELLNAWGSGANCCGSQIWGMYFTRNGTLPANTQHSYDPRADLNVAYMLLFTQFSGTCNNGSDATCRISLATYIQRSELKTVNQENVGTCGGANDCLFAQTSAAGTDVPASAPVYTANVLNFTGYTNKGGTGCTLSVATQGFASPEGCSYLQDDRNVPLGTSSQLPWLAFQGAKYYVGFFASPGSDTFVFRLDQGTQNPAPAVSAFPNKGIEFNIATFTPPTPASPTIDDGGFFGPLVRFFLSAGVFIISNILSFASFIWNNGIQPAFSAIVGFLAPALASLVTIITGVIKSVLDAIGNALGLGNVGTNLFTFFGDVGSFFTTFFGNAIAQVSSFITFLNNGYSTISASFNTYWTDLTNWTSGIKDFLSGLWVIANQITWLSFSFMFSGWLLYGAKRFSDSVGDGMEWFNLTRQWVLLGVAIVIFLLTFLITHVITPSMHAIMATGEAKKTAEPDIEIGGTGVG